MPRTKPLGQYLETDADIRAVLSAYMSRTNTCRTKLGPAIGISSSGFCEKFNNPENFSIGELRRAYDCLKVPEAERVGLCKK